MIANALNGMSPVVRAGPSACPGRPRGAVLAKRGTADSTLFWRTLLVVISLVLFMVPPSLSHAQEESETDLRETLNTLVAEEEYDEAIALYKKLLKNNPDDRELRHGLAETLSWNGQNDASIEQYRELLKDAPNDREIRLELARVLSWAGYYEESIRHYEYLLEEAPLDDTLLLETARVMSWAGKFGPSIEKYNYLLSKEPSTELKLESAKVLTWAGRYTKAIALFTEVLEEDPSETDAVIGRAQIYFFQGKYTKAERYYKIALLLTEKPDIHIGLGSIYQYWGLWAAAEEQSQAALSLDPEDKDALEGLESLKFAKATELGFRYGIYRDANGFNRLTYSLDGAYKSWEGLVLRAGILRSDYEDISGEELTRDSYSLQGDKKWGHIFSITGGYSLHNNGLNNTSSYSARVRGEWDEGWVSVGYARYEIIDQIEGFADNFYSTLTTIEAIRQNINTKELKGEGGYRLLERLAISGGASLGRYSDENNVWSANGRLTYGILNAPYLATYYSLYATSYKTESLLYWSPSGYQAHGIGVIFAYPIENITLYFEESLFYQPDETQWGNTFIGTVESTLKKRFIVKLTTFFFDSDISSTSFHAKNIIASLGYLF